MKNLKLWQALENLKQPAREMKNLKLWRALENLKQSAHETEDLKQPAHETEDLKQPAHETEDLKLWQALENLKQPAREMKNLKLWRALENLKQSAHETEDLKQPAHETEDLKQSAHEMGPGWFSDIEEIISDDLRFKAQLKIGEDAYASLKLKNVASEIWDVLGVGSFGASVAGSSVVASHFFAAPGILGFLGIGAAATPVGWLVAAGVLTGGAYFGITRYLRKVGGEEVIVVPRFINTPLDALALGLFDLIAPLSIKVAAIDGHIADEEIDVIRNYFIKEWGYSTEFTDQGISFFRENIESYTVREIATALADLTKENRDCNFEEMANAIVTHLKEIAAADGRIDERESMVIEQIERVFGDKRGFGWGR